MLDKEIASAARRFQPTYKLVFLSAHSVIMKVSAFVAKPFIAVADYFNATDSFKK